MRFSHVPAAMLLTLAIWSASARADDEKRVDISGFGTGGVVITDNGKAEFSRAQQAIGANTQGDSGVDSLFGLQATFHLSDRFSATVQGMARRLYGGGFDLDVPLMFVRADVTKELAVRVGRVQLPVFMNSDFREVGYANTWVRPPIEVYGQEPLDSIDGMDVLYRRVLGPLDLTAQAFYGKATLALPTSNVKAPKNRGVNVSATMGPLTLRAARTEANVNIVSAGITQILAGLNAAGFPQLAAQLDPTEMKSHFTAFGFGLDWRNWVVQGEITKQFNSAFAASTTGKDLIAGYRVGKFTPYAIYATRKVTSERTDSTIPQVGALIPLALGVNALIGSSGSDQHTNSIGIRWDVHDSVDLKLQIDRVSPQGDGLFINVKPGFKGPVTVGSLALDFIF
jgi:hypothetical protein